MSLRIHAVGQVFGMVNEAWPVFSSVLSVQRDTPMRSAMSA
jgi:hypothetical protein